jgi:hypothetical protein
MLRNASEMILVPKNIFSLKILNFVQCFVECKESLADGSFEESIRLCSCMFLEYENFVAYRPLKTAEYCISTQGRASRPRKQTVLLSDCNRGVTAQGRHRLAGPAVTFRQKAALRLLEVGIEEADSARC